MSNGIQVTSEFFWQTNFFPTSWTAVFSQLWRRSIFRFCVYKFAEAVRYLKFKWEVVIIGRGCLVLLKVQVKFVLADTVLKLCKGYVPLRVKLPCVNPTSLRADSQWIIILATFELVTLSFSQFHAQWIDSLPMPYISLISTWDCYAVFEAWCD